MKLKGVLMERVEDFLPDVFCERIFRVLMINGVYEGSGLRMRYSEIKRELDRYKIGVSDSTLSKHLEELTAKKVITRKEKNRANSSYAIELASFEYVKCLKEFTRIEEKLRQDEGLIRNADLDRIVDAITCVFFQRDLLLVRLALEKAENPKFAHTYSMHGNYVWSLFRHYERLLVEACRGRSLDEYKKTINYIDRNLEKLRGVLAGKISIEEALAGKITMQELKKRLADSTS